MKLIETLTFNKLTDLIFEAKKHLFISLPGIDDELAQSLIEVPITTSVHISIDNSEDAIRNGYGAASGIEKLRKLEFNIRQCAGNSVSFIISDEKGYFIFPHSKIFSEEPKGPNAFKLDPVTIQLLIQNYFPDVKKSDSTAFIQAATIGDSIKYFENTLTELEKNGATITTGAFDDKKFEIIKNNLALNPPLPPDLKRLIDTYNAEVQFAELNFVGSGIRSLIIHYPKDALPVDSEELKQMLNSTMKLFGDLQGNPIFSKLNLLQFEVEDLRDKYLIPISCRPGKSILKKKEKLEFEKKLIELRNQIIGLQDELPGMLDKEKEKTITLIRQELIKFFKKNPPKKLKDELDKVKKQQLIDNFIEVIIRNIDFPNMQKLAEKMILRCSIFDLTWNDFSDEELLKEFEKKRVLEKGKLDTIVAMNKAYDVKK